LAAAQIRRCGQFVTRPILGGLGFAAAGVAVVFAFIDDIWYARSPASARAIALAPTWFAGRGAGGVGLLGLF